MSSINDLRKDGPGFDTGSGTSNSDILEIENPNVTVQEMQKQQRIKLINISYTIYLFHKIFAKNIFYVWFPIINYIWKRTKEHDYEKE